MMMMMRNDSCMATYDEPRPRAPSRDEPHTNTWPASISQSSIHPSDASINQ